MPLKFSRASRLVARHDFQSMFKSSDKLALKCLLVLYRFNQKGHARLGVIINKRFVNRAVDRNRLRRILRESFRHHQEYLKGLDIIVLMRSKWSTLRGVNVSCPAGGSSVQRQFSGFMRSDIDDLWQRLAALLKSS